MGKQWWKNQMISRRSSLCRVIFLSETWFRPPCPAPLSPPLPALVPPKHRRGYKAASVQGTNVVPPLFAVSLWLDFKPVVGLWSLLGNHFSGGPSWFIRWFSVKKQKAVLNLFVPNILSSRILSPLGLLLVGQKNQSKLWLNTLTYFPGMQLLLCFLLHVVLPCNHCGYEWEMTKLPSQ